MRFGSGKSGQKKFKVFQLLLGISTLAVVVGLGSTLAANINLNSSAAVEFGQGVAQTTACDNSILVTPLSVFVNENGGGAFKLSSITLSEIDSGAQACASKDFTIKAYSDSSSEPLNLVDSISSIVVSDSGTTFATQTSDAYSLTQPSGDSTTFTISFDSTHSPISASQVYSITIESTNHDGYLVGSVGPGGGTIFFISESPFTCGPTRLETCNYLEAAPTNWIWDGGTGDTAVSWIGDLNYGRIEDSYTIDLGYGEFSTSAMVAKDSTPLKAGTIAYDYQLGDVTDWFLPSKVELNELCKFAHGQTTGDLTVNCNNSTALSGDFQSGYYWSSNSNGHPGGISWAKLFSSGYQQGEWQSSEHFVRPIRSF